MANILLIRHGDNGATGNRLMGRLTGVHLSHHGWQQARNLAEMIAGYPLKAIYCSPLERTLETASALAEATGLSTVNHPGLIEINYGAWQGKTSRQLKVLKRWQLVHDAPSKVRFPAGETFIEAQERILNAIEDINARHGENDLVACFSHCDPIRLAVAHYLGMPLDNFQRLSIELASITHLYLNHNHVRFFLINHTSDFSLPVVKPAVVETD